MRISWSFVLLSLCTLLRASHAAPPAADYLFPAGGQRGTTVEFTAGQGKGDAKIAPWPAKVWADCAGLSFQADKTPGRFSVKIADDCPIGPHLVRIHNDTGASAPKVFVVGKHPEVIEPEKAGTEPRPIPKLPAVANGQLAKPGEVDTWAVDVEAGRWLVAELQARRLGSPIDAFVQIVDPAGAVVALGNDDFGFDPLAAFKVEKSGRYLIRIAGFANPPAADVRFAGSPAIVYRLNVTTGPYARAALPPAVERGENASVRIFGWNLPGGESGTSVDVEMPADAVGTVHLDKPQFDNPLRIVASDQAGVVRSADATPMPVEVPAVLFGHIVSSRQTGRYALTLKKGTKLSVAAQAAEFDSPIDPLLTVTDADGKRLQRDGAQAGKPAQSTFTAPADGKYTLELSDLQHTGSPFGVYRLDVGVPGPRFDATTEVDAVAIPPGKSGDLKITVTRSAEQTNPLTIAFDGLPEGVSAKADAIPEKGGAVTIKLSADENAKGVAGAFRVWVVDEKADLRRPVLFAIDPAMIVPKTPWLWLTVGGSADRPPPKKP